MRKNILRSLWSGTRLVCPNCQGGRIYNGWRRNPTCPACGVRFERSEEGDFLITVVTVYSTTAVLISALIFIINLTAPDMALSTQITLCLVVALSFSLLTYRNFKGLAVGLLYLTFGLKPKAEGHQAEDKVRSKDTKRGME